MLNQFNIELKNNQDLYISRSQLCIKEEINKSPEINQKCKKLIKDIDRQSNKLEAEKLTTENLNIEDFKSYCIKKNICPYYLEIEIKNNADIILTHYNYLLMKNLEDSIEIEGSIIIFDQAHNIPQVAEDNQSFKLSQQTIIKGKSRLLHWEKKMKKIKRDTEEKIKRDYNYYCQQYEQTIERLIIIYQSTMN